MACVGIHMSTPRGTTAVPLSIGMSVSPGRGRGKRNVSAIPASVAKPRNGMVKISIPSDTWRIMWCGDAGSSTERRGSRERDVVAGISGSRFES